MRRGVRFTPTKLRQWQEAERGTGVHADYIPWHRVSRADPASRGRSRIVNWHQTGRTHHFLSDLEFVAFCFTTMLPGVVDVREQFPLDRQECTTELAGYYSAARGQSAPGTIELADRLGIRHPVVRLNGDKEPWIATTDLLVALRNASGRPELLAIAVKGDGSLTARQRELLMLERAYWSARGVAWLLLKPSLYLSSVANSLVTSAPWAINSRCTNPDYMVRCAELGSSLDGRNLTQALQLVQSRLHLAADDAPFVFWQAIWAGLLPIDFRRSNWPSAPIQVIDQVAFRELNPIASRRSACL